MKLYKFENLDNALDRLGYPKLQAGSGFQIIKGIDFEKAYKSGSISFEDDGIYLEYEGKMYRGYMFIQEAFITYNDGPPKFPKFHLFKCQTIQSFINSGRFKHRYEWSNSDVNNLVDKQTGKKYKDVKLDLCGNCKNKLYEVIEDTAEFYDLLDKSNLEEENIQIDIFGYVKGKEKISKAYRKKMKEIKEKRNRVGESNKWFLTIPSINSDTPGELGNGESAIRSVISTISSREGEGVKILLVVERGNNIGHTAEALSGSESINFSSENRNKVPISQKKVPENVHHLHIYVEYPEKKQLYNKHFDFLEGSPITKQ